MEWYKSGVQFRRVNQDLRVRTYFLSGEVFQHLNSTFTAREAANPMGLFLLGVDTQKVGVLSNLNMENPLKIRSFVAPNSDHAKQDNPENIAVAG